MDTNDPNRKLTMLSWSLHGLGAAVVLVVALLTWAVACRPIQNGIVAGRYRVQQLDNLLKTRPQQKVLYDRLGKELAEAREQAEMLNDRVPEEPQEAVFLAQVSKLANDVGLSIQDYRPGAIKRDDSHCTMRVDLICRGRYSAICKFLDGLPNLPRHSTIVRLQITSEGDQPEYSADVSLELYFAAREQLDSKTKKPNNA